MSNLSVEKKMIDHLSLWLFRQYLWSFEDKVIKQILAFIYLIYILLNTILDLKSLFLKSTPPTLSLSISSPVWCFLSVHLTVICSNLHAYCLPLLAKWKFLQSSCVVCLLHYVPWVWNTGSAQSIFAEGITETEFFTSTDLFSLQLPRFEILFCFQILGIELDVRFNSCFSNLLTLESPFYAP